jgi:ATP-binding cassette subfamily B protein
VLLTPIPLAIASRFWAVAQYRLALRNTPGQRWQAYCQLILTDRRLAQEVRAYDLAGWFGQSDGGEADRQLLALRGAVRLRRRQAWLGIAGLAIITALSYVLIYIGARDGTLTLGGVLVAALAILQLRGRIDLIVASATDFGSAAAFMTDYADFARRERAEIMHAEVLPRPLEQITVRDLTFAYRDAPHPALRAVSLELRRGCITAIVGENGSGKSTLIKLLAGLYEPTAGRIEWNGQPVTLHRNTNYQRRIGVMFQDYGCYELSITQNIAFGDVDAPVDEERVRHAASLAGVEGLVSNLPRGFDTVVGRQFSFEGDLSVGQMQRLALARALYRNADLLILDEPTAFVDANAETHVHEQLVRLASSAAVLVVSHRPAMVALADQVYVLKDGCVVAAGAPLAIDGANDFYDALMTPSVNPPRAVVALEEVRVLG